MEKKYNPYIYFSANTTGRYGKAVKIKLDLIVNFLSIADPNSNAGVRLVTALESLKNIQANSGSMPEVAEIKKSDMRDSYPKLLVALKNKQREQFDHDEIQGYKAIRTRVKRFDTFEVFYYIAQKEGDNGLTVYVSNIRFVARFEQAKFYTDRRGRNELSEDKNGEIDKRAIGNGFITGFDTRDARDIAEDMPRKMKGIKALFVTPKTVAEELRLNRKGGVSLPVVDTIAALQKVLYSAEKSRSKLNWTVEAEGVTLLDHALENTGKIKLENQTFTVDEKTLKHNKISAKIKNHGAKLALLKNNDVTDSTVINEDFSRRRLLNSLVNNETEKHKLNSAVDAADNITFKDQLRLLSQKNIYMLREI